MEEYIKVFIETAIQNKKLKVKVHNKEEKILLSNYSELTDLMKSAKKFSVLYNNVAVIYYVKSCIDELMVQHKHINYIKAGLTGNTEAMKVLPNGIWVLNELTYENGLVLLENNTIKSDRLSNLVKLGVNCVNRNCSNKASKFYVTATKNGQIHVDLYTDDDILITLDHIIPKSKGGLNTFENYQMMCSPCNNKKGSIVFDPNSEINF